MGYLNGLLALWRDRWLRRAIAFGLGLVCALGGQNWLLVQDRPWEVAPVAAQIYRPEDVAEGIYQQIPDLPRENRYLSQETGQVDGESTLISRFIRYHQYVKNRPLGFRLDWQLSLADYLGANERMIAERYPGFKQLQTNPLESDRTAIQALSLQQRRQLVDQLASIYVTPSRQPREVNSDTLQNAPSSPPPRQPQLILPQPGAAGLLLP
ncbi:MAG: hypothetical protein HC890_09575 [Chloroflexaceae bacterium]|nr:hypothetical protein [Chloroflexaceae bacterium]